MFLDLTDDQQLLMEASGRFIEERFPLTSVRDLADGGEFPADCTSADYTREAARLGWFAMLVPEDEGGRSVSGNGLVDAAIIARERGRRLQPGRFVGTNVTSYAISRAGHPDVRSTVLPRLVAGEQTASWAVAGPAGDDSPGAGVRAERREGGYLLSGRKTMVQDPDGADWLLVTAEVDGGLGQFLIATGTRGVTANPRSGLDITRSFGEVYLDDVAVPASAAVGTPGAAADLIERQLSVACVLTVAETVGAMEHDFGLALAYAKERIAFGRPIGSFQAVKHLLADTSLLLEMSKAAATAAARTVGDADGAAPEMASIAKAFVGDCAVDLAQNCFQVFGGVGFMWSHDQHLYLRRLTVDAALYGSPAQHRERLCRLAGV
jgi:alkylation response protein AidB-like acyl-CoA dehydrogenase